MRRLNKEDTYESFSLLDRLLLPILLIGVAIVPITVLYMKGEVSMLGRLTVAVGAFVCTFFLLLPLAVTELRRFPIFLASNVMRQKNTALVGSAAAEEYARVGAVAVMCELFLRKGGISLGECRGKDPDLLRYYALSILSALGEPFSGVVDYWEKRDRKSVV